MWGNKAGIPGSTRIQSSSLGATFGFLGRTLWRKTVYARELSAAAAEHYNRKITMTGLQIDPYSIENDNWTKEQDDSSVDVN